MTTLFGTQLPVFFLLCHLLAFTAAGSQKEQKHQNRHRKSTTTANDIPRDSSLYASHELPTSTAYAPLHQTPIAQLVWDTEEEGRQSFSGKVKVTRRTAYNRKLRKTITHEPLWITTTPTLKNRARSIPTSVADRIVPQLEDVAQFTRIAIVAGHQKSPTAKSQISLQDRETTAVVGFHRNPKVRTSSTTAASVTSTTIHSVHFSLNNAALLATNPSAANSNKTGSKISFSKDGSTCRDSCDMSQCPQVQAESCKGRVIKDHCSCCPVCLVEPAMTNYSTDDPSSKKPTYYPSNACDGMVCTKNKVCILNIQGIPMCRCPNIYSCRNGERNLLCAQNGVTYKNKCFLKVDECTTSRRIRVIHKGACRSRPSPTNTAQGPSTLSRVPPNVPAYSNTRMQDSTKRKAGKNSKNAGNNWRNAAAYDETRVQENRHRKRFGSGQFA